MKRILIPALLFFVACQSNPEKTTSAADIRSDTAKNYLPVRDYIQSEIAMVDSFPFRIMKYSSVGQGKPDSGIITTADFDQIAKQFLLPDLDSSRFEKRFEENSFIDRSTNLVSFTYSTKDGGSGLKRVDVLLTTGGEIHKLSSIYMESITGGADTTTIRKLSWKAGRNFRILDIQQPKKGKEITRQTIVIWDSSD